VDFLDLLARWLGRPPAHEVVRHDLGWTPALRKPKRPPPIQPDDSIAAFWAWWAETVPALANLDHEPPSQEVLSGLDTHLSGLHRELAWELGPGVHKKHALTVSPDGVSALRTLTAAWRAQAPTHLPDWEFHDVRPPVPGPAVELELETAGRVIRGHDVQIGVFDDEDHHRLDVWVHHPEMKRANKRNRWSLAFLLVDAALGEARVATWLRTITPSPKPLDTVPDIRERVVVHTLDALRARVAKRERQGDAAPPPLPDHPGAFQIDPRARRWRHPRFDTRLRIEGPAFELAEVEAWLLSQSALGVPAVRWRRDDRVLVDVYTTPDGRLEAQGRAALPNLVFSSKWDPGWGSAGR